MKRAFEVAALAALAAVAVVGCGGGSGGEGEASAAAPEAAADVPDEVALSWPARYGYLLSALGSAPDRMGPARLPGESGPTSDVVEAEVKP